MLDSADPNWFVPATATTITRYRVRLSGSGTVITAWPRASVFAEGTNNASASKFCRWVIGRPGGSVWTPPSPAATSVAAGHPGDGRASGDAAPDAAGAPADAAAADDGA